MTDRNTRYGYGTIESQEDAGYEDERTYAGELADLRQYVSKVDTPVIVDMYEHAMHEHPLLTTVAQTSILVVLSDICAQVIRAVLIKGEENSFDPLRLCAVGIWSVIFMGPSIYWWHETLNWWITGSGSVVYKTLMDQLVFAPFFCGMFIFGVGLLELKDLQHVVHEVREKIGPTMTVNYCIWPAVLLINFSFIPKTWRLLFLNSVGFFWIILLTYITHRKAGAHAGQV